MNKYEFKITEQFNDTGYDGVPNNRVLSYEAEFHEEDSWEVPLKSFVDFLSSFYGYDISEHIHTETIFNNRIFNHIPRDDEFSRRIRESLEEHDDWK